ncbi:MAG: hypothetical protein N3G19_03840, partial [Candidatus Pacearchaeota archaeon]|nr:hypothetical protein [Candidatus Pacearchaeota archaeon]
PILGVLMVIAGIIMLVIALNQPPGFMQGLYFSLGTGFTVVGALVTFGLIPGVGWIALAAAVVVAIFAAGIYYISYDEKFYLVQCNPSTPPFGGDDCEKCNGDEMRPCSKYRCESLGTACKFVDKIEIGGVSYPMADGKCVARENKGRAPWITEIEVFDLQGKSVFKKDNLGTEPTAIDISMDNKPVPDSTSLDVKIKLNDDSICRWDYYSTLNITDMDFPYESTVLRKELRQRFFIRQNMSYIHVRCADAYGNANVGEYIFRFATTTGPDMTPPVVLGTDRDYYKKFAYGTSDLPLFIYVNEAATCKWSKQDTSYDLMTSRECKTTLTMGGFRCDTNLSGLQPDIINYFYIRCQDTSEQKNAMQESYQLALQPSPALAISSVEPADGSVIESCAITGVDLTVVTSSGAEEGKATCSWSNQGYEIGMQKFTQTGSTVHTV